MSMEDIPDINEPQQHVVEGYTFSINRPTVCNCNSHKLTKQQRVRSTAFQMCFMFVKI